MVFSHQVCLYFYVNQVETEFLIQYFIVGLNVIRCVTQRREFQKKSMYDVS